MNVVSPIQAHEATAASNKSRGGKFAPFKWDDALMLEGQLTEDERAIRDAAHEYCQEKLFPRVLNANRHEKFDREIMNEWATWAPGRHPGQPRLRRRRVCRLWADCPRGGAGR